MGVKIGSWGGRLGLALSPVGVVMVSLVVIVFSVLYTLHRDGLLVTGYHLWAGSGTSVAYDPPYPPSRPPRYWSLPFERALVAMAAVFP